MPKGQMRLYRRAARLQGVSSAVACAICAEAPSLAQRIAVVPLPLPWAVSPPNREPGRTILYTGRIDPEKGLPLLIAAARELGPELAGWRIRIVGPADASLGGGGAAYLALLRRSAGGLPVEFAGAVFDAAQLRDEYAAASIFVYPSIAEMGETFGLAPLEAMSCRCPAVVSALACFREFIEPGKNGAVFDHRAPDAAGRLARELRRLIADEPLRQRLAADALATARRFEPTLVAEMYLADFAAVVAEQHRAVTPAAVQFT